MLIQRYPAIVDGAFIIIAWVGSKLLVESLHAEGCLAAEIPQWFSLTVIVSIFVSRSFTRDGKPLVITLGTLKA